MIKYILIIVLMLFVNNASALEIKDDSKYVQARKLADESQFGPGLYEIVDHTTEHVIYIYKENSKQAIVVVEPMVKNGFVRK